MALESLKKNLYPNNFFKQHHSYLNLTVTATRTAMKSIKVNTKSTDWTCVSIIPEDSDGAKQGFVGRKKP